MIAALIDAFFDAEGMLTYDGSVGKCASAVFHVLADPRRSVRQPKVNVSRFLFLCRSCNGSMRQRWRLI